MDSMASKVNHLVGWQLGPTLQPGFELLFMLLQLGLTLVRFFELFVVISIILGSLLRIGKFEESTA